MPCHPLQSLRASETFRVLLAPPPPLALSAPLVGSPPARPLLLFLSALARENHPWKPNCKVGVGSGGPSSATVSRGFCKAEFPWEHVRVAQGTPPSQPTSHDLGRGPGAGGALPGTATAVWPPAFTNLKSSYRQICLFFLHSNLKATLHSKDASGVPGMDFYVVQ